MRLPTPVPKITVLSQYAVEVNGIEYHKTPMAGCRPKFLAAEAGIMVKLDAGGAGGRGQFHLWHSLDEEDRPYFSTVVAYGRRDDEDASWYPHWVAEALYDDLQESEHATEEMREHARALRRKYDIIDWAASQWKIRAGSFIIHDYSSFYSDDPIECRVCDAHEQ